MYRRKSSEHSSNDNKDLPNKRRRMQPDEIKQESYSEEKFDNSVDTPSGLRTPGELFANDYDGHSSTQSEEVFDDLLSSSIHAESPSEELQDDVAIKSEPAWSSSVANGETSSSQLSNEDIMEAFWEIKHDLRLLLAGQEALRESVNQLYLIVKPKIAPSGEVPQKVAKKSPNTTAVHRRQVASSQPTSTSALQHRPVAVSQTRSSTVIQDRPVARSKVSSDTAFHHRLVAVSQPTCTTALQHRPVAVSQARSSNVVQDRPVASSQVTCTSNTALLRRLVAVSKPTSTTEFQRRPVTVSLPTSNRQRQRPPRPVPIVRPIYIKGPAVGTFLLGGAEGLVRDVSDYRIAIKKVASRGALKPKAMGRMLCSFLMKNEFSNEELAAKNVTGRSRDSKTKKPLELPKLDEKIMKAIFCQAKLQFADFRDNYTNAKSRTVQLLNDSCKHMRKRLGPTLEEHTMLDADTT